MTQPRSWLKYFPLSLMFVVLCGASVVCFAQLDRGSVAGIVTDSSGSTVRGAKVTVTNMAMGTQSATVTTSAGDYSIPELAAGQYSITVVAPGFEELVRNGITVSVGETATVNLQLTVGQASATITVTADAPLLQTDSAQNNVEVTTTNLNELPINIPGIGAVRDPMGFAALVPGTISGGWNDVHISGSPATTYRVFMDGLDDTSAVKGAISDEQQPSVESLGSESLLVNDYSAKFGESGGGVFNYTSKSGTNQLHGTAFTYFYNEDLDAGQPFNYISSTSNQKIDPVQRELSFGASLGGPLVIPHLYHGRNKTFFFFAYEEYHNTQTLNNGTITVPTQAYLTGDLSSNLLGPIVVPAGQPGAGTPVVDCLGRQLYNGEVFDPTTTRTVNCTAGPNIGSPEVVRNGFGTNYQAGGTGVPTNFIGAPGTWDTTAQQVLKYMPAPSGATANSLTNNYPNNQPNNKYQYLSSIKLDHSIGEKWHFSGYGILEYGDKDNATDGINGVAAQTRWNITPAPQLYLNADYTATPNLVLHAGFDFTRHDALQDSATQNFNISSLGLTSAASVAPGGANTFPIFTWGSNPSVNHSTLQQMGNNNAPFIDDNYYDTESAIWTHGRHVFEFGGDFRHQLFGTHNDSSAGTYQFSNNETSEPSEAGQNLYGASLGDGFASFALGLLDSASIGNDNVQWFHRVESGIHTLDTWRVTNKLTVNYGLRWDFEQMQREQYLRETQFSPSVVNPSAGDLMGGTEYEGYGPGRCNCTFERFYPWMIQPRLGVSYQLDAKTVIHAGSGFYSGPQLFMNEEIYSNQGFGFNTITENSPSYGIAAGQLSNGVPFTAAALTATNFNPGAYPNAGQTNSPPPFIVPNNGRSPRFLQTTVGVEREILNNLTVNASFIDIRGAWLNSDDLTNTTNELTPSMLSQKYGLNVSNPTDYNLLTGTLQSALNAGVPAAKLPYPGFNPNNSLAQALRPYPQFGGIGDYYEHDGNWWYDALQVKLTKRLSHGLSGGLGYSWSKNLGTVASTNQATFTTAIPMQDPSLPAKSQKSFETIDQPQMLNFYFNYQLPAFSFDQNGWKHAVLTGWTADGIFHYQSGMPIQTPNSTSTLDSVTFANSADSSEVSVFANRVPGQPLFLHSLNKHDPTYAYTHQFLNPAAWANPAQGTYSTSKPYYGDYRGPRYPNEQLGFGKVVPIKEGITFSLRADFFNVFNRWAYPNLNNTSNPFQTASYNSNGVISSGFGFLGNSLAGAGGNYTPRTADFVARIQF